MNFLVWLENNLNINQEYIAQEIQGHVASNDVSDVADWMNTTPENLSFIYKIVPISIFEKQAEDMFNTYSEFIKDKKRTDKIIKIIRSNKILYPVFVKHNDPSNFILEGRHRIVAFWQLKYQRVPVLYVRINNS